VVNAWEPLCDSKRAREACRMAEWWIESVDYCNPQVLVDRVWSCVFSLWFRHISQPLIGAPKHSLFVICHSLYWRECMPHWNIIVHKYNTTMHRQKIKTYRKQTWLWKPFFINNNEKCVRYFINTRMYEDLINKMVNSHLQCNFILNRSKTFKTN